MQSENLFRLYCIHFDCVVLPVMKEHLRHSLSRKYKNFLSSDWVPAKDAQRFPLRDYYVPIMLEEEKQTPGGAQTRPVSNLFDAIREVLEDETGNFSLLMKGKF